MFTKDNLTDFEKLQFSESHVKYLKKRLANSEVEKGFLKSEISELDFFLKKETLKNMQKLYEKKVSDFKKQKIKYDNLFSKFIILKNNINI